MYGSSSVTLSKSVTKLAIHVRNSNDKSMAINQNIGSMGIGLNNLTVYANCFTEAVFNVTDEDHNLNMFKIKLITDCLKNVTRAQLDISADIEARLDGRAAVTSTDGLPAKIDQASQAMEGFARAADNVRGITALFFGIAQYALFVNYGLGELCKSLNLLANAISVVSDLAIAVLGLATAEGNVQVSFGNLANLSSKNN